ncbi:hypothetical protein MKO06_16720 [Gramella sp. GC03-9]|uniref:Uncharacterized protein n=1 Tax=Christiangramia oceanisediminis TaxID=2920386 RepID=A0A9X2L0B6_9FLAO|nr:hypothetical protein [Gramella oceanisediminis]MCP9201556.1 hypothetical protein [Gramella oceanisediminis]
MISGLAAQELNNYKYVLIPESYEFLGEKDQYRLNSLTKFLFNKQGYNTLMKTEEKPADLQQNPCLALNTRLENNSGLFTSKLVLILEDCYGKTVYRSPEGISKEKEYEAGYQEALREAFAGLEEIDYQYEPGQAAVSFRVNQKEIPVKEEQVTPEEEMPVEDSVVDNTVEEKPVLPNAEKSLEYSLQGKIYLLKDSSDGYGLYLKDASEPIALLIKTGDSNSFIYNSLTNQGIAYFDSEKNLVVEYVNRQTNQKVQMVYDLIDQ